jgi:hypothetical protein
MTFGIADIKRIEIIEPLVLSVLHPVKDDGIALDESLCKSYARWNKCKESEPNGENDGKSGFHMCLLKGR